MFMLEHELHCSFVMNERNVESDSLNIKLVVWEWYDAMIMVDSFHFILDLSYILSFFCSYMI